MLQVKHIRKEYRTENLVQTALDDVSINFRDNEFVAILGPSGSGKTTLLNVVGGLDRYDSGDLIINGLSTRHYKDSDWDYYRSHTIGFVFQSYNLIPHQTILSNVELALTIAGVSRKERRERAIKALEDVGLGDQLHKRPNQMSGGQMQRVAIARALVNDPDIVLADEPTGALDSVTSIQVMELLKEVAKDRLVIMVTHNPELAARYATRTVRIKDGKVIDDTDPFTLGENAEAIVKRAGKSSMSFLTALSLSFNNLRTKKARTLLVSIAGSIGIIGIALVMALSNGATTYINAMERQAMGSYPLQISSVGYDLSSMLSSGSNSTSTASTASADSDEDTISVTQTLTSAMSTMSENDLASLKEYIESGKSDITDYTADIEYLYDAKPQIYLCQDDEVYQVSPSSTGSSSTLFTTSTNSSDFYQLPRNTSLYEDEYEIKAGHWPENSSEAVLVLNAEGSVTDTLLYEIGIKSYKDYEELMDAMSEGTSYQLDEDSSAYTYDDFLGRSFKVVSASDYYVKDETYHIYTDKSDNADFLKETVANGTDLTIVGIVQPAEDVEAGTLSTGIGYTYDLTEEVMQKAADSDVVKAQMADPATNVLTGKAFTDTSDSLDLSSLIQVDEEALQDAFQIDDLNLDTSAFTSIGTDVDLAGMVDTSSLQAALPSLSEADLQTILSSIEVTVSKDSLNTLFQSILSGWQSSAGDTIASYENTLQAYLTSDEAKTILTDHLQTFLEGDDGSIISSDELEQIVLTVMDDYQTYVDEHPDEDTAAAIENYLNSESGQANLSAAAAALGTELSSRLENADIEGLLSDLAQGYETYASANNGVTTDALVQSFTDYLSSEEGNTLLLNGLNDMVDLDGLSASLTSVLQSTMTSYTNTVMDQLSNVISALMNQYASAISSAMENTMASLSDSFSVDTDALASAFSIDMDSADLEDLLSSMMNVSTADYNSNLQAFGYADESSPSEIDLYPKDFDARSEICALLDDYNEQVQAAGESDKTIVYTDLVATMLSSVTDIIHTISYILIAFVGISLVVSSIMIGVITYISVLERRKEIGILRALGASKHNIAQVFNAETFITGLLSGLIGVGAAVLLCVPLSSVIHHVAGTNEINMSLPIQDGLGLILLSIVLTVLAGIIPSHKAAKSDPVAALRTE